MEGAVLGGKLAAEVIADRAAGNEYKKPEKVIQQHIIDSAAKSIPKEPVGVLGKGSIAFGGGDILNNGANKKELAEQDPEQLVAMG